MAGCVCKIFTKSSRAISNGIKDVRKWLLEPFRADERLYFAVKLIAIAIATAFVWFFGWRGITIAQDGIKATIQSNKLSAKQVCSSAVRVILVTGSNIRD
jgi:cellobiose-specific phosphotransferase system component IIC